jgi:hypothetical protein
LRQANGPTPRRFRRGSAGWFDPAGTALASAREPNVDGALGSCSKSHAGTGAVPYTR